MWKRANLRRRVTVRIFVGLGNQLFMYAAGRHLSLVHGCELALDLSHFRSTRRPPPHFTYELDYFDVAGAEIDVSLAQQRFERGLQPLRRIGLPVVPQWVVQGQEPTLLDHLARKAPMGYPEWFADLPADVYLAGYFQSPRYFEGSEDVIRRDLTFVKSTGVEAEAEAFRQQSDLVALHVRRTDALANDYLQFPGEGYFRRALDHFGPNYNYMIFTDDVAWCRERFKGSNIDYSTGRSGIQDFALISACSHAIISNSSFSWWAAWLNANPEKQVVAPKKWFNEALHPGASAAIVPADWVSLES